VNPPNAIGKFELHYQQDLRTSSVQLHLAGSWQGSKSNYLQLKPTPSWLCQGCLQEHRDLAAALTCTFRSGWFGTYTRFSSNIAILFLYKSFLYIFFLAINFLEWHRAIEVSPPKNINWSWWFRVNVLLTFVNACQLCVWNTLFMSINRGTITVLIGYSRMKLLSIQPLNKRLSPHSFIINTFDIQR
jgi:hypothetical protein